MIFLDLFLEVKKIYQRQRYVVLEYLKTHETPCISHISSLRPQIGPLSSKIKCLR